MYAVYLHYSNQNVYKVMFHYIWWYDRFFYFQETILKYLTWQQHKYQGTTLHCQASSVWALAKPYVPF